MVKYSKKKKVSEKTEEDAVKAARATQRPGQTKEQTKLIAQGIKKGIEQYKKNHKAKSRELDKKLNKIKSNQGKIESVIDNNPEPGKAYPVIIPWALLIISWLGFIIYFILKN